MKVLIADENSSVRYGLAVLLEELPRVRILGEAANFKELISLIMFDCPEMLLLGWELTNQCGANMLKAVRLICPSTYIVVLSSQLDIAAQACEGGADVFISKAEPPEKLLRVIAQFT